MPLCSPARDRTAESEGPSCASARVAPVYLIPLLAASAEAGIAGDALFHGLGMAADDFDVPGFTVTREDANTVVRRALRLLDAPHIGLTLGVKTRITERGALALGLMAAATLGESIALALEFPRSAGHLMRVREERREHLHLVIAEPMPGNEDIAPFLVDILFAGTVRLRRQVSEPHYAPTLIEMVRSRPSNAQAYERHFACPMQFGRGQNVLSTDLAGLEHPLPMANVMAYRLSRQLLEREFQEVGIRSPLRAACERMFRRALPVAASLADMASSLNLGERTLRRKLAQEGLSFRGLLDEARKSLALELLAGQKRSVTEIALATGFSGVRAFSRAYKRWTDEQST